MRIFYVTKSDDAKKIASYLINSRLNYSTSYTFPDVVHGPARFVFKLAKHQADIKMNQDLFVDFLIRNEIAITNETVY